MSSITDLIKKPKAEVYQKAFIKRRLPATGLFETDWVEITSDVKSYGKITSQVDAALLYKFTFGNVKLVMDNDAGKYNPHDSEFSLWYNFLNQQRTLVKIEAGYVDRVQRDDGVWVNSLFPSQSIWDVSFWDAATWDESSSPIMFTGLISGDIMLSDKNDVSLNVRPLISVFQEFPAANLTGWTTTGLTSSQFITMLRDQTDGAGSFIFRPFFGDTTSNWDISTTTNVLPGLNTAGADEVINKTVWQIIEKLAEAENFVPYTTKTGVFRFISRASVDTTPSYQFRGAGAFDTTYGQTIKTVNSLGRKVSKYYSRVQVRFNKDDTSTSYAAVEASFAVSGTNNPWVLGHRSLEIENFYINGSTLAASIANAIFTETSSLKKEIEFTTSFVPHLDLFDRFSMYYDPAVTTEGSLWDQNNWAADDTSTSLDLTWDSNVGDAINLDGSEFKFLSFELDLDKFENKFLAREV